MPRFKLLSLVLLCVSSIALAEEYPAITRAAIDGKPDQFKTELEKIKNPSERNAVMVTSLNIACLNGHTEIVTHLLKQGVSLKGDSNGETGLHALTVYSYPENIEIARMLIKAGADLHAKTLKANEGYPAGLTPLEYARESRKRYGALFGYKLHDKMIAFLEEELKKGKK